MEVFGGKAALLAAAVVVVACQPPPMMTPGVPLQIQRGYCLTDLKYFQRGEERDSDDVVDHLASYPATKGHISDARAYRLGQVVTVVGGVSATAVGLTSLADMPKLSEGATTALIIAGGVLAGVSLGLCFASEGEYATAVEVYNQKVVPELSRPARPRTATEKSGSDSTSLP